jgi:hypothetical protein
MEKFKLFFYCPDCNKRHSNCGLVPLEEKYGDIGILRVICGECMGKQYLATVSLSKSEITDFYFPVKIPPEAVILAFGKYNGHPIVEIPNDYLEFVLVEQVKPANERQYEVGFSELIRNIIELYLGKWWHPIDRKWIFI